MTKVVRKSNFRIKSEHTVCFFTWLLREHQLRPGVLVKLFSKNTSVVFKDNGRTRGVLQDHQRTGCSTRLHLVWFPVSLFNLC